MNIQRNSYTKIVQSCFHVSEQVSIDILPNALILASSLAYALVKRHIHTHTSTCRGKERREMRREERRDERRREEKETYKCVCVVKKRGGCNRPNSASL